MSVRVRFFARFRELFGPEVVCRAEDGRTILELIRTIAEKNPNGYNAVFDENGAFRRYVILMCNGKRIENSRAKDINVTEGDEIAVFPPVAGG